MKIKDKRSHLLRYKYRENTNRDTSEKRYFRLNLSAKLF